MALKIAYITDYDSNDVNQWSGLAYYIGESLIQNGVELTRINCSVTFTKYELFMQLIMKLFFRKEEHCERYPSYLKKMAKKITEAIEGKDFDILFGPGSMPFSYLNTTIPVVFFTDATYDNLVDFYPDWDRITKRSIRYGNLAESKAISNAALIFYASEWARQNALQKYNGNPQKIMQLEFGANLTYTRTAADIAMLVSNRSKKTKKNFLFIGVDWHRKGAEKAIATVQRLRAKGIDAHLTIVGCAVPKGVKLPSFVTHHPYISKSSEAGVQLLDALYKEAHFFILPTTADCFGIVFAEAASYGLPVLTSDVGGCPSAVLNNVSGYCFGLNEFEEKACEKVLMLATDEQLYAELCTKAFQHYKAHLNWDIIGKKAVDAMQKMLDQKRFKAEKHALGDKYVNEQYITCE